MTTQTPLPVRTCLWFNGRGEEAARFYTDLVPGSRIERVFTPEPGAKALVIDFTLGDAPFQILDAGAHYALTPALSISVTTPDQAETDRLWSALLADGGSEMACGWLTDRFGVSWQIVPRRMIEMLNASDRAAMGRAFATMQTMIKLDVAALERAFAGE